MTAALRRTALYDEHVRLGGRMVPFGGFEMPVQYAGILREHDAVRRRAGLFDLSHMAQYELFGDGVAEWADSLTINAVATMKPLQARYNIFCNDAGGALDDVLFYRLPDRWLLVVNAANADKMWAHLQANLPAPGVRVENKHGKRALIAIQGPKALEILAPFCDVDIAAMKYYFCSEARVDGVDAVIARTGYTGEDGFEIFLDGEHALAIWNRLLALGSSLGIEPAGLGSRDMLRLEAGMPLYGHELTESISPIAGGQSWAFKPNKGPFVGRESLVQQAERDDYDRIAGIVLVGRVPARADYDVYHNNARVGEVRSASLAPSLGNANIATVLVPKVCAAEGTTLEVEIRGKMHEARVVTMPFYKRK